MTQPSILLEINQGVALLTLNRPDNLNSFNVEMHERMRDAISTVRTAKRSGSMRQVCSWAATRRRNSWSFIRGFPARCGRC